jgi:hypothetical protein
MKPEPGETIGCVECQADFQLSHPAADSVYVPRCPSCGIVVDGYEDAADMKRRSSKAVEACEEIEVRLTRIIENMRERRERGIHEATSLGALQFAADELNSVNQFVSDAADELVAED